MPDCIDKGTSYNQNTYKKTRHSLPYEGSKLCRLWQKIKSLRISIH